MKAIENNTIMVSRVKSNKSEALVWEVSTSKRKKHYCKNALSALRYCFILKAKTGRCISAYSFDMMMSAISKAKARRQSQQENHQEPSQDPVSENQSEAQ